MKAIKHLILLSSFGLASVLIVSCISSSSGGGGQHSTDAGNHSGTDAGSGGANHGTGGSGGRTTGSAGNHNVAGAANTDAGDGSTPTPTLMGPVGAKCNRDNDCAAGLTCLTANSSDWLGGGIANGYCTASCVGNPSICAQFPGTACVGNTAIAFCFETCTRGPKASLLETKCQDREDVACFQPDPTAGAICQPACGTDAQCPQGRRCDLFSGVCLDSASTGDPIGTPCDPSPTATNTCQGFCLDFGDGAGACSGFCTLGPGYPGCGVEPSATPAAGSPVCWFSDLIDNVNDTGLCLQRCNASSDCLDPDLTCAEFHNATAEATVGALGLCLRSAADAGSTADAGDAGDGG